MRRGFTLTEMLVATAITVMILLIFAQIYRAATTTIIEQRGIAQNDARARMLSTLIRGDLQKCSFRDSTISGTSKGLLPLTSLEPASLQSSSQFGYVYISENDIDNDVDDVLQFTVRTLEVTRFRDTHPYVGKASRIGRPTGASSGVGTFNANDQNQPEFDDGDSNNGATQSQGAEVAYFVRNGVLYRRVLLLRDPLSVSSPIYIDNPTMDRNAEAGAPLIPGIYDNNADLVTPTIGDFWNDFDSSAVVKWNDVNGNSARDAAPTDTYELHFNGLNSLNPWGNANALGLQQFRFGFNPDNSVSISPLPRRPREYAPDGTFLGRFTHEETSHPDFGWPGNDLPNNSHPYKRTDLTVNSRGIVTQYQNGPRMSEDVLLPNVDAFDVKVWDPAIDQFKDLGYAPTTTLSGYFDCLHNLRKDYGPRGIRGPSDPATPGYVDPRGADGQYGVAGVDDDNDGTTDNITELGWPGSDDIINRVFDTWHPIADVEDNYSADDTTSPYDPSNGGTGTNFFPPFRPLLSRGPRYPGPDDDDMLPVGDAELPVYTDWANVPASIEEGTLLFPVTMGSDRNSTIVYQCVQAGDKGPSDPNFPPSFPQFVPELAPGTAVWQSIDNRIGLTMIQITIRYRDVGSNLPRQLTIVHSFAD